MLRGVMLRGGMLRGVNNLSHRPHRGHIFEKMFGIFQLAGKRQWSKGVRGQGGKGETCCSSAPPLPRTRAPLHKSSLLFWALLCLGLGVAAPNARATGDGDSSLSPGESGCPLPALERLKLHRVASGETIASIARQYELLPATLLGMNPVLRRGEPSVGTEILIPPYNGIRLRLQPGETLEEVAQRYNLRQDVLFEVNGCQVVGGEIFVPGVNWSPLNPSGSATPPPPALWVVAGYPLAAKGEVILGYGSQLRPAQNKVAFHSGIDLQAREGTPVLAAGDGVVVFVGERGAYGNLVVINHAQQKQTRYAHLQGMSVQSGQEIRKGDRIGTVGSTGRPDLSEPHLHFEVRSASELGWVAENPEVYIR